MFTFFMYFVNKQKILHLWQKKALEKLDAFGFYTTTLLKKRLMLQK